MKRSHPARLSRAAALCAAATAVAITAAACGGSSGGGSGSSTGASAPGITKTQILIGSHQPLTGPAAPGYSEIAPASNAYFSYVNAHGGINGRKIVYKYLDDGYDPSKTSSVVRQLVLQNSVFGGVQRPRHADPPGRGGFLNAQKVPDVFVASGCVCWNQPQKYP